MSMTQVETLRFAGDMFLMGMSATCAVQLFQRRRERLVYLPLALFFTAQAIVLLPNLVDVVHSDPQLLLIEHLLTAISQPTAMAMAPLFWFYIRMLTSEMQQFQLRELLWHFPPIILAMVSGMLFFGVSPAVVEAAEGGEPITDPTAVLALQFAYLTACTFYLQVLVYLSWTLRILYHHNSRLKDLFASTEHRELRWVWWIAISGVAYWVRNIAEVFGPQTGLELPATFVLIGDFADLALMSVIAIWGMRQRPTLSTSDTKLMEQARGIGAKYSRSALTEAHMSRIAAKIDAAMQRDHLYDNPNLSLWDLANHVGVSTNYVSQTLSFAMKRKFFDYVNSFRIKRAATALLSTDATILSIAFDVGFNSRSSFYRAFKLELGMTPMELRRQWTEERTHGSLSEGAFIQKVADLNAG